MYNKKKKSPDLKDMMQSHLSESSTRLNNFTINPFHAPAGKISRLKNACMVL